MKCCRCTEDFEGVTIRRIYIRGPNPQRSMEKLAWMCIECLTKTEAGE